METTREELKPGEEEGRRFIIPSQEPQAASAPPAVQPSRVVSAGSYADYIFQKESKMPERKPLGEKWPELGIQHDKRETKPGFQRERREPELSVQCERREPEPGVHHERREPVLGVHHERRESGPESKLYSRNSPLDLKEAPRTETSLSTGTASALKPGGGRSCIVVSPRQRGNPLLKHIRNIPWEFGEIVPDYLLGETCCALFLSLRYHNLNPEYIHTRLRSLGQCYALRVLLVLVDVKDPHCTLKELAKICILSDCTLILSWSPEEAARYLETYKCYEQKPADALKERTEGDFMSRITDCLTTVKSVNKTDSGTLLTTFGTLADLANASREDLSLCPGLGPQKAKRLFDALHEPFLKANK
ncbi:DNA excision repair protein ERCC-1 isoform X2 [Dendropsophus ebraccatus]|uniref:DNA excision repair protein ERCC-1 isoform X2 n=1 Tax=Dendropsophus ebraccatus TaxID=150705 RepID=UPI00383174AB